MARQVITLMKDDLDGGEADQTVTFGLDNTIYTIDLSDKNAKELRSFLERYTVAGQRAGRLSPTGAVYGNGGKQTGSTNGGPKLTGVNHPAFQANRELNQEIREWAAKNGYQTAERGRIPQHIVDAFHKGIPNTAAPSSLVDQDALPSMPEIPEPEPRNPKVASRKASVEPVVAQEPEPEPAKKSVATRARKAAAAAVPIRRGRRVTT